jgi:predicted dehydrogenase
MNSKSKIKVGVIGVGVLGQVHTRIYSELSQAEVAGVYDINTARAKKVAKKYNTEFYKTIEEMLPHIQAASIAVPSDKHYEVAKILLEHNINMLIEKPITTSVGQAEDLVLRAEKKGVILQVGHVERFNPVMKYVEDVLTVPRFIECHRLAGFPKPRRGQKARGTEVSVVLDLMIHDLEIILHIVNSPIKEIRAVGIPVLTDTEDIANVRLAFQNGTVANITTSRVSAQPMRKIRIFQENAYISLDYQNQSGQIYKKRGKKISRNKIPIEKGEPLLNELSAFIGCISNSGKPLVTGQKASQALKLAVDIIHQIRKGSL